MELLLLLLQAIGVSLVVLGFWMYADQRSFIYTEMLYSMPAAGPLFVFDKLPIVFICSGGFIALLSFLGCCGACSESVCFLSLVSFFSNLIYDLT